MISTAHPAALASGEKLLAKPAMIEAVEAAMRAVLEYGEDEADGLPAMQAYHLGWEDCGEQAATRGKGVRPLLTLLSAVATGGEWRQAVPFAAAVELVHNFSLVHDDIQDGSLVRRGRPTVWAKWGEPHGINAGDSLFAYAHLAAIRETGLPSETRLAAVAILDRACIALARGQYLDLSFESRNDVTVTDYLEMVNGKTASLLGAACELGGLAGGASHERRLALRALGLHLGMAFQVRDDLLGIWGDPALTGKPAMDIARRKKTLPLLMGRQRSEIILAWLDHYLPMEEEAVIALLSEAGVLEDAQAEMARHGRLAIEALDAATESGTAKDELMAIARQTMDLSDLRPDAADGGWQETVAA